jgi:2-keto-3-deoxy-L-rhamnonate aldolase RhmA
MLRNRIREALDAGGTSVGTWVNMKCPDACEAAAAAGFDFVVLDGEHGGFDLEGAMELIRAVEAGGATPVLRLLDSSAATIQKALEAGAAGIFISEVRTGEEVSHIVQAAKYPPQGIRGSSPFIRATRHGIIDWDTYREWAEGNIMVWVMVENMEAVDNIEAILASGVDAICVGPYDLSMFMGLKGDFLHPDVVSIEDRIVKLAVSKGIDVVADLDCIKEGEAAPEEYVEAARAWEKRGCRIVTMLNDRKVLTDAYKRVMAKYRES